METFHRIYSGSILDNRDPENLARVLVRVSGLRDASNDVWARLAAILNRVSTRPRILGIGSAMHSLHKRIRVRAVKRMEQAASERLTLRL